MSKRCDGVCYDGPWEGRNLAYDEPVFAANSLCGQNSAGAPQILRPFKGIV
jgi:hypothetical protein